MSRCAAREVAFGEQSRVGRNVGEAERPPQPPQQRRVDPRRGHDLVERVLLVAGHDRAVHREQRQPTLALGPIEVVGARTELDETGAKLGAHADIVSRFASLPPMVRSEPGHTRAHRLFVLLGLAAFALAGLLVVASAAEHMVYSGHVLPDVQVDGAQVSGKSDKNAAQSISALATRLAAMPIHARAGNRTFVVDPSFVGFTVDTNATLQHARDAGRNGSPLAIATDSVLRRFRPDRVPLVVHYDNERFQGLLDGWSNALDSGLTEGGLRFVGTTVLPIEPHAGTGLIRAEAARRLAAALDGTTRGDLELPMGQVTPATDAATVAAAAAQARALLAANHTVTAGATSTVVTPAQLVRALGTHVNGHTLALTIDPAKLAQVLAPVFAASQQPAVAASFRVNPNETVSVVPSRDGRELDINAVAAALLRNEPTIVAQVRNVHPAHDTAWATKLGITRKVSSFTTFHTAGQPRVHNIHLAADVMNNTVVEPGQIFSENKLLGPRTPQKGYVKAPILVEDGFGEDYGGGVSQLTTTLYNAVFFGGYADIEHSAHHYYISRYPMGREATISYPSVDLKFKNDTKHGVLIRTSYSATSITVTLYGNTDGRTADEENRKILSTVPIADKPVNCPVADPTVDPNNLCATLAKGQQKVATGGETGYDVEFDRVIDEPGQPPRRTHYYVHYPMLPNTVLVGTAPPTTTTTTTTRTTTGTTGKPAKTTTTVRHH